MGNGALGRVLTPRCAVSGLSTRAARPAARHALAGRTHASAFQLTLTAPDWPSGVIVTSGRAGSPPWRHTVLQLRHAGRWETLHLPVPGATQYLLDATADRAVLRAVGRTGVAGPGVAAARVNGVWRL